jgi:hypothetical protein
MKIVAAHPGPSFSVHDVHVGWVEALRKQGHLVADYNLSQRLTFYDSAMVELPDRKWRKALTHQQAYELAANGLYALLYVRKPDLLLVTSAFFYPEEMFDIARSHGTRTVLIHTESPYEDDRQLKLAAHADYNLINDPTNLDKFRSVNPNTWYMPHSYRPGFHEPGSSYVASSADFAFVGTGYPSRVEFFESMDFAGIDVLLAGNWQGVDEESSLCKYIANEKDECLDNEQTVSVYRSSKVGMNLYRKEAESEEHVHGWACGPREIEMAACGMFFLREPHGESDELFPMLPTFRNPGEASEQLHYWLAHEELRQEQALKARAAIEDRTFHNRAADLMRLLDNQGVI